MIYDDLKNIINVNKRAPGKYEQGFNDPATTDPEIVIIRDSIGLRKFFLYKWDPGLQWVF